MPAINMDCTYIEADDVRPIILGIYPDWEEGQLIAEYLHEKEQSCNYLIVDSCEVAREALKYRPNLILVDVLLSKIGCMLQLQNLRVALDMDLLPRDEIKDLLQQIKSSIMNIEARRAGIALAQEIRQQIPGIPVIFTSSDKTCLQSLPFGVSFDLKESVDSFHALVEQVLREQPREQPTQSGSDLVLELPRKRDYHLHEAQKIY